VVTENEVGMKGEREGEGGGEGEETVEKVLATPSG